MCNHQYKNYSLNKKNFNCRLQKTIDDLPVDVEGKCIFHSTQLDWKADNDFVTFLKRYINQCSVNKQKVDLREVHFVAKKGKAEIDYIDCLGDANLECSHFHHVILMRGKNKKKEIGGRLHFNGCIFHHDVIFNNCVFHQDLIIENISQEENKGSLNIEIEHCLFEYFFEWNNQTDFSADITLSECEFNDYFSIDSLHIIDGNFEIMNNVFNKLFIISNSVINTEIIDFSHNNFKDDAEFKEVELKGRTLFNHPKVEGKLMFSGSTEHKIFYGRTEFKLHVKDIRGQIIFQHAQLMVIEKSDLDVLKNMEKLGDGEEKKVKIGPGCIKYRWQTPAKTLKIGTRQSYIIEDLTRTFASFLSNSIQKNIGVEIVDRTRHEITFFYFSDENFVDQEFQELFIQGQQAFFDIMSGVKNLANTHQTEDEAVNMIHTRLKQINMLSSIVMELQRGNWDITDSKALLESLLLNRQEITLFEDFHRQLRIMDNNELIDTAKADHVPLHIYNINLAKHITQIKNMHGSIIEHRQS